MLARGEDRVFGLVDVKAVAESTIALARPELDPVARLVCDFGAAPLVVATEARIAQILLNLVGNALEAMRDRPRERHELVVRIARSSDGRLLLEVADNGRGIAAKDLARVFEPFFSTKPAGEGTGLGLPIVQRLVMELGGEVTVASTLGAGASFHVLLPAATSATDSPAPEPAGRSAEAS
jgi:signal transduction histidine kinase